MGIGMTYLKEGFAKKRYYQFPNIINLEVFRGLCPCSCVHCPVGRMKPKDRTSFFGIRSVSQQVLEKVVSEMKYYPHSTLRLHSVGDPIMWENLSDAVSYIHGEHINNWIFTSLVTNNTTIMEALANNCSIIEVSVNSVNSDDYKNTKGIDSFYSVVDNIKWLSSYIKANHLKTRLIVSRVQSSSCVADELFVDTWKKNGLVDDAFVRKYHNYNNILGEEMNTKTKPPCLVHWMRFNISCDGLVVSCFNELFRKELRNDVIVGDINKNSIFEIWHGEYMKELRHAELSGYSGSRFSPDFPCKNCSFCQAYNNKNITSEYQVAKLGKHD